jgi:hypothetical protein
VWNGKYVTNLVRFNCFLLVADYCSNSFPTQIVNGLMNHVFDYFSPRLKYVCVPSATDLELCARRPAKLQLIC